MLQNQPQWIWVSSEVQRVTWELGSPVLVILHLVHSWVEPLQRSVYLCLFPFISPFLSLWASQVAQWVKNPPAMQEMQEAWVPSLGQKDPLEEEMASHSSSLAWTEETGATVHRVTKSQALLKWLSTRTLFLCICVCACTYTYISICMYPCRYILHYVKYVTSNSIKIYIISIFTFR